MDLFRPQRLRRTLLRLGLLGMVAVVPVMVCLQAGSPSTRTVMIVEPSRQASAPDRVMAMRQALIRLARSEEHQTGRASMRPTSAFVNNCRFSESWSRVRIGRLPLHLETLVDQQAKGLPVQGRHLF